MQLAAHHKPILWAVIKHQNPEPLNLHLSLEFFSGSCSFQQAFVIHFQLHNPYVLPHVEDQKKSLKTAANISYPFSRYIPEFTTPELESRPVV